MRKTWQVQIDTTDPARISQVGQWLANLALRLGSQSTKLTVTAPTRGKPKKPRELDPAQTKRYGAYLNENV